MKTQQTPPPEGLAPLTGSAFARRLREAREIARLTQEEAARRADMQPSAWSHMETGTRTPTIYNLAATCRAVRCSADWLLGLSTERPKARVVIVDGETFIPQNEALQRPDEVGSVARSGSPAKRESGPQQSAEAPRSPAKREIAQDVPTASTATPQSH